MTRELFSLQLKSIISKLPKSETGSIYSDGNFFLFERLGHAINQLPFYGTELSSLNPDDVMLNLP